jgi:single-strand DNA-binding protein
MNKVIEIGNLTRDPELATTTSGTSVCKMSIAVNRNFTNADGEREADFFNVVAWRTLAENCAKFLSKGKKIAVCGRLQSRSYDDDEGNRRYVTEIVAEDVEFLTPLSESAPTPTEPPKKKTFDDLKPIEDDGLPF